MPAGEIWSVAANPAMLASIGEAMLATDAEQRFLIKDLAMVSLGAAVPAFDGGFAVILRRQGFEGYHQTELLAGYGREFGRAMAGLSLQYQLVSVPGEYDDRHSVTYRIGFTAQINPTMRAGFAARNPFRPVVALDHAPPPLFQFGFSYSAGPGIIILGGIEKEISRKIRFKAGCEIERMEKFRAAIGIITSPGALTVGGGIRLGGLSIDIAGVIHQFLGYYPQCSLEYHFLAR